ncbi:large ribosomal subunit protein bL33m [Callospermophilus lateralis]
MESVTLRTALSAFHLQLEIREAGWDPTAQEASILRWGRGFRQILEVLFRNRPMPRKQLLVGRFAPHGDPRGAVAMFLSVVSFAKSKSKTLLVKMVSQAGTGFSFNAKRSRLREKLTLLHYDPLVKKKVLFTEQKKIRSL